jgi:hypothetical protein
MQPTLLRAALAVLPVIGLACSAPRAPTNQGGGALLTREHHASVRAPGWLELRDLTVHTDAEKGPPSEPYVRGSWIGGFFDATGEIVGKVGDPPRGRSLTRGYLELRTRAFYRNDDSRAKIPPFVEGSRDDDSGSFFPAGQIVWSAP